jgi:hypothetical protein
MECLDLILDLFDTLSFGYIFGKLAKSDVCNFWGLGKYLLFRLDIEIIGKDGVSKIVCNFDL